LSIYDLLSRICCKRNSVPEPQACLITLCAKARTIAKKKQKRNKPRETSSQSKLS
jgi:hypothetical protein